MAGLAPRDESQSGPAPSWNRLLDFIVAGCTSVRLLGSAHVALLLPMQVRRIRPMTLACRATRSVEDLVLRSQLPSLFFAAGCQAARSLSSSSSRGPLTTRSDSSSSLCGPLTTRSDSSSSLCGPLTTRSGRFGIVMACSLSLYLWARLSATARIVSS
jgi:hypothetical protein